jgi:starch phosphorylase
LAEQPPPAARSLGHERAKAVLNGALNLSVLDGWWAEAFDGSNGFSIGDGRTHVDDRITDRRDAEGLYETLEQRVIPTYYDRDRDGVPRRWIKMMMNSISTCAWRFSSHRMVMDYTKHAYIQAAGGLSVNMDYKY